MGGRRKLKFGELVFKSLKYFRDKTEQKNLLRIREVQSCGNWQQVMKRLNMTHC